jgi:cell volume regulation protein A
MHIEEPHATALLLLTCGLLLAISVLFSRASQRFGVPIALLFLGVGMLAGSEGLGGIDFEDYEFAFRIGVLALALILFDGGLNTPLVAVRRAAAPARDSRTARIGVLSALAIGPRRGYEESRSGGSGRREPA